MIFAGRKGSFGKVVQVQHAYGVVTTYAHLAKITVRKGADVVGSPKHGQKRYSRPISSGLSDECSDLGPERFFVSFAKTHVDLANKPIPANQIA